MLSTPLPPQAGRLEFGPLSERAEECERSPVPRLLRKRDDWRSARSPSGPNASPDPPRTTGEPLELRIYLPQVCAASGVASKQAALGRRRSLPECDVPTSRDAPQTLLSAAFAAGSPVADELPAGVWPVRWSRSTAA